MYLQYMAQNKMHSTGVMICFEQKKQSFSKIRSEDGYRGSDSEVTWKLLRWLTGMMSSFYIITEENERKFWPGLLRRTWYSVKVQFSSVQLLSRVRLCDHMDCSMPAFSVHNQVLELAQTHVHWEGREEACRKKSQSQKVRENEIAKEYVSDEGTK